MNYFVDPISICRRLVRTTGIVPSAIWLIYLCLRQQFAPDLNINEKEDNVPIYSITHWRGGEDDDLTVEGQTMSEKSVTGTEFGCSVIS